MHVRDLDRTASIADHGNSVGGQYATVVDINEAGQVLVVGSNATGSDHVGFWDGSTLVDIGTLGGFQTYPARHECERPGRRIVR